MVAGVAALAWQSVEHRRPRRPLKGAIYLLLSLMALGVGASSRTVIETGWRRKKSGGESTLKLPRRLDGLSESQEVLLVDDARLSYYLRRPHLFISDRPAWSVIAARDPASARAAFEALSVRFVALREERIAALWHAAPFYDYLRKEARLVETYRGSEIYDLGPQSRP